MLGNKKIKLNKLTVATQSLGLDFYKKSIQASLNFSDKVTILFIISTLPLSDIFLF